MSEQKWKEPHQEKKSRMAKALHWTDIGLCNDSCGKLSGIPPGGKYKDREGRQHLPNWPEDLNACHEAALYLVELDLKCMKSIPLPVKYVNALHNIVGGGVAGCFNHVEATALQKFEALYQTLCTP